MKNALHALLSPAAIAVLGASSDPSKLGGRPIRFLQEKNYAGRIYPVNPNRAEIAGLRCYPDVASIPGEIDLAIVAVPAADVAGAIRALGMKGVPAAIVFSSGFGETGEAGAELERALKAAAQAAGVRVLGPNNLGLINSFERVFATFSQFAAGPAAAGPVGFVTQSGAFGTGIAALAQRRGIGLGYFVNTGNECDIRFDEIVAEILDDARIRVVAGYVEGLKDGEGFVRAARRAHALGKPLLVTKVGRSSAGARAAASHTGSLAGEDAVFDGVARQFGVVRARNEEHLLDLAEVFCHCALPAAEGGAFGVGIVTMSGGAGVLMADRAEELGLAVPVLSPATQARLKPVVPGFGATGNPVDVTAQFLAEPAILRDAVSIVLDDPGVHVGVIWLQLMDAQVETLLGIFDELIATAAKPFVVVWVAAPEAALAGLRRRGIAVLRGAEPAIDAIAGLARHAQARARLRAGAETPRIAVAALPACAAGSLGTLDGAALLERFGIPFAAVRLAADRDAAIAAAAALGYPVALKIESKDIPHKTEAGGVVLGLQDAQSVGAAYDIVMTQLTMACPGAAIDGVAVQKMEVPRDASGVEVVVGIRRDPAFGNVVMAGLGGIFVEVLRDVAFRKVPVSGADAESMLDELKGRAILGGVRGRPAVRRAALVDLICRASALADALGEHLVEADLNPVIASSSGAVAVDWLIVLQ